MKTVTAFVGSARKNGVTHRATRQLLEDLQAYGDVQGELVFLSECSLGLCRGCKACILHGEERCPLHDDRDVLLQKMMRSDGVVLASPVYSFQVSALMKAFLDRLGFALHRPRFHGKAASRRGGCTDAPRPPLLRRRAPGTPALTAPARPSSTPSSGSAAGRRSRRR